MLSAVRQVELPVHRGGEAAGQEDADGFFAQRLHDQARCRAGGPKHADPDAAVEQLLDLARVTMWLKTLSRTSGWRRPRRVPGSVTARGLPTRCPPASARSSPRATLRAASAAAEGELSSDRTPSSTACWSGARRQVDADPKRSRSRRLSIFP
ncbi:hypothetical protein SGFS_097920 [Streptomyces graminofaciens]|uniref:Uncharacterized protein n=1 Tax=Streptomyces graminofaciens TaxID=68212 RepID=A0ABN5VYQ6_9ACTN|nr:hypothetical protein SGFS_097920 [Streptomyces graminofaciens]